MKFNSTARIRFISVLILAFSGLLVLRLFFIQVVKHDYYNNLADRQYMQPAGNLFDRGTIYFQTKDGSLVSAATLQQGYVLAINPQLLTDKEAAYSKLNSVLPLDHDTFIEKAANASDTYEELTDRIPEDQASKIAASKIKGVIVSKERWRFYPAGSLASQVIGLMGFKGNDYTGRYGLERYYNNVLTRTEDETFVNFFAEIFSGLGRQVSTDVKPAEGDIVLTIEPTVQNYFEQELAALQKKWQSPQVGGIIMDPKTGEIIAMAALPDFDPGQKVEDISALPNPLVERVYEMGSVVKALTMASAIDVGAVTASTTYKDVGYVILNKAKIENYDKKGRGVIPMQEVINQSLNTGAVFAMQRMGENTFSKYLLNFGIGQKTGIDLPGEVSGLVKNLSSKEDVDRATASFGQGIALTPIEITRALAALGNNGYLVQPHVVKQIRYTTKLVENIKPVVGPQVINPETSKAITAMLVTAVDTALAQGKAKMDHMTIAAKTGTAQIAQSGGYDNTHYLHSFFGYFPAYSPRFIVFFFMVNPQKAMYATNTMTVPFMHLSQFLINYYNIPPDR